MSISFDYVVIGAGTAGCVMASRLCEHSGVRVALLEAGSDCGPASMSSANNLDAIQLLGSSVDWAFTTTAQKALDGAVLNCPRGKVLGGSSSINGLLHVRGHASSYDAWAKQGATDWNYETMLPYLKRSERVDGRNPDVRGVAGPMRIEQSRRRIPLPRRYIRPPSRRDTPKSTTATGRKPRASHGWNRMSLTTNGRARPTHICARR